MSQEIKYSKCCNAKIEKKSICSECNSWCDKNEILDEKLPIQEYEVHIPFAGYIRGTKVYKIESFSEEEAIEKAKRGCYERINVIRDDTETDFENGYVY
jgi:hypothetical protein